MTALQGWKTVPMDAYVEDNLILSQHSFEYNLEKKKVRHSINVFFSNGFKTILSKAESPSWRSMMYLLRNNVRADL